jgi:hypothetical protein
MALSVKKVLKAKRRGEASWSPGKEIYGFREDGTDLVILGKRSVELERYPASQYESWVVEAQIESEK